MIYSSMMKRRDYPKSFLGKKHKPESIEKMREAQRKKWERIKADPEWYKEVVGKISANHARSAKGKFGSESSSWKGGRWKQKRDGYVYVYVVGHPYAKKGGGGTTTQYILEHRLVMEKVVGRYLLPNEDVNHINGIKDDNRPENLMLVRHNAHFSMNQCPKCDYKWGIR